ncbi:MAG: dipeptidase [Ignavibacteriaceae bacterium]
MNKILLLFALFLPGFLVAQTTESLDERINRIHSEIITLDTHTDTPLRIQRGNFDIGKRNNPYRSGSKLDFPRMREGGLDAVYFALYVGQGKRDEAGNNKAVRDIARLYSLVDSVLFVHSDKVSLARSYEDFVSIKKEGKLSVALGIENGYALGNDLSLLDQYYKWGVRYITLCHSKNNDLCDSSTDPDGEEHGGLSEFGKKVVAKMNDLGILIDISHVSDKTVLDVLEISKTPVFASHSCAAYFNNISRNINDNLIKKIAQKGGVVQVCFFSGYLKQIQANPVRDSLMKNLRKKYSDFQNLTDSVSRLAEKEWYEIDSKYPGNLASVSDIVDHIDHIVKITGIDHVGIGTDFDGGGGVQGAFDVSEMKNITRELLKRGYSEQDIKKIWGDNYLRVLKEAQIYSEF